MERYSTTMVLTLTFFGLSQIGCSPLAGHSSSQALQQVEDNQPISAGKVPACTVDYADFALDTQVLAFEIVDRSGVTFGFNIIEGFFQALGLSLKSERGQMVMSMGLSEVTRPKEQVAYVTGRANSSKREFSFKLDAIKLGTEFSYFKQTPLSNLLEKTLRATLNEMDQSVREKTAAWKSKVVHVQDDEVVIPTGTLSGVRPGDEFALYNVDYLWAGKPCDSDLLLERKTTTQPIARAVATQVENNATLLTLLPRVDKTQIRLGARVEVSQLVQGEDEDARTLSRPVRLRTIKSRPLDLPQNMKFDVVAYAEEQLRALLSDYGFQYRP